MSALPRISVLGVHRLPVDDATVNSHRQEFRIRPGPDLERLLADIREMLESTVLVELRVTDRDERFDAAHLRQPRARSHRLDGIVAAPVIWYLTADGEGPLESDNEMAWWQQSALPPGVANFRVALYVRGWDESQPLRSCYGDHPCPEITAMPARLRRLAPYFWVGD
jgi:hypothetical protein